MGRRAVQLTIIIGLSAGLLSGLFWSLTEPTINKSENMNEPILNQPAVQRVLFHPRQTYGNLFDAMQVYPVTVEVAPNISVTGRLYPATPTAPFILFFHGNGEIAADYDNIALMYTRLNISFLVMDYRGYGSSDGRPTSQNLVADALPVYEALPDIFTQYGLSPTKVYIMGRSLGSVPAIEIAHHAEESLAGLIIESGFADTFALLRTLGLKVEGATEAEDGFGNAHKISQTSLPTLIIHGKDDQLIPPGEGKTLYQQAGAEDKRLVLVAGGHNDLLFRGQAAYFEAIAQFVAP